MSVFLALWLALLSGCGTFVTRGENSWHYPYKSAVEDVFMITDAVAGTELSSKGYDLMGMMVRGAPGAGVLSLPLDLVIDTVLLPVDVGVGAYRLVRSWWDDDA
jgi:uncharacterized protein YceK